MKTNNEWISISDMMSGLMMVFLFIAISFMIQTEDDKNKAEELAEQYKKSQDSAEQLAKQYKKSQDSIKEIVITYRQSQEALNQDLYKEFKDDLSKWGAEITKENIIRFNSPDVLFKSGSSTVSNQFMLILDDFFPRYIKLLISNKYKDEISEVRVEGHTSTGWKNLKTKKDIYLNNMSLSQNRANNVLRYCYSSTNQTVENNRNWLEKRFRANGMAFSKLIYENNTTRENSIKSRRVEFKVLTKAQNKIYKIIEQLK